MSKIAIYPGTFDPITFGHLDILKRSAQIFDQIVVGIAINSSKPTVFTPEERLEIARHEIEATEAKNIKAMTFGGLLIDFVKSQNARVIVRGLRAVSDFEFEFQMSYMNHKMAPEIETVFLPATENSHFISSSFVKQISKLGGDMKDLVSPYVAEKLRKAL